MRTCFRPLLFLAIIVTCSIHASQSQSKKPLIVLQPIDPEFSKVVSKNAKAEILADGFAWSEGPLWVVKYKIFLFSDVKKNIIYKWTKEKGKEVYLTPAKRTVWDC